MEPRDLSSRKSSIAATGKWGDPLLRAGQKPLPAHASATVLPGGKPGGTAALTFPIANATKSVAGNSTVKVYAQQGTEEKMQIN